MFVVFRRTEDWTLWNTSCYLSFLVWLANPCASHKQIDDAIDKQFSVGVSLQLQDRPCWLCLIGQGISIEWLHAVRRLTRMRGNLTGRGGWAPESHLIGIRVKYISCAIKDTDLGRLGSYYLTQEQPLHVCVAKPCKSMRLNKRDLVDYCWFAGAFLWQEIAFQLRYLSQITCQVRATLTSPRPWGR